MTTTTTILVGDSISAQPIDVSVRRGLPAATVPAAALAGLGLMHFALDGLTSVLVPLQPVLTARTGARPALLGLVVAIAMASASLLQPLTARLVHRRGEPAVAAVGAALAAIGYGSIPATNSIALAVGAVVIGGLGSALFHPAAGALVARTARTGREALPLAAFSAVGTAGTAIVPFGVLASVDGLGWAAAVPVAVALVALTTATRAPVFRPAVPAARRDAVPKRTGGLPIRLAITAGALIALAGTTVAASAAVLTAQGYGTSHPAVAWVVAIYSASGAAGGMALAVWARRVGARLVLLVAIAAGSIAAAAVPFLPMPGAFLGMAVAGAGLSGSLPLLVVHARRPGETSAAGAVGRILGLAAGLGGAGYAAVGLVQTVIGYGAALTVTAILTGAAALSIAWFLCRSVDPSDCLDPLPSASATCGCGSCACS